MTCRNGVFLSLPAAPVPAGDYGRYFPAAPAGTGTAGRGVSLSKRFSFSSVYFKAILLPPGIQVVLLYQNPAGFANRAVSGIRQNAHAVVRRRDGFCRTVFYGVF